MGDKGFLGLGAGFTIDTSKKFTLVTQFISSDGTTSGTLKEIRRIYIQDGKVYQNSQSQVAGLTGNSLTDTFCAAQKSAFDNTNHFKTVGGMAAMGNSFKRGMVLALSLWDDYAANALWLDSTYPVDGAGKAGAERGPCGTDTGKPADVESKYPGATAVYSNIKWGEIDSTYSGTSGTTKPVTTIGTTTKPTTTIGTTTKPTTTIGTTTKPTTSAPSSTAVAEHYAQCGGKGWAGATVCRSPYTCKASGEYYSQCL
jgi:cellulose 1,4-beta-cellobiosidase